MGVHLLYRLIPLELNRQVLIIGLRIEKLKPLVAEGALAGDQVFQAEQNLRDRERSITQTELQENTNTKEQVFQAEQSGRDRQRAITQTQGDLQQARAEVQPLQAGLVQKEAEKQKIQLESQQQIKQIETEITQLKAKLAETKNLNDGANAKLKHKSISAPIDGIVSSLKVHHIGEVVQPSG